MHVRNWSGNPETETAHGRIEQRGTMSFTLRSLSATFARNSSTWGQQDPYLDLEFCGKSYKTTMVRGGGIKVAWSQPVLLEGSGSEMLQVTAKAHKAFKKDRLLGSGTVDLRLAAQSGLLTAVTLKSPYGGVYAGQVFFKVTMGGLAGAVTAGTTVPNTQGTMIQGVGGAPHTVEGGRSMDDTPYSSYHATREATDIPGVNRTELPVDRTSFAANRTSFAAEPPRSADIRSSFASVRSVTNEQPAMVASQPQESYAAAQVKGGSGFPFHNSHEQGRDPPSRSEPNSSMYASTSGAHNYGSHVPDAQYQGTTTSYTATGQVPMDPGLNATTERMTHHVPASARHMAAAPRDQPGNYSEDRDSHSTAEMYAYEMPDTAARGDDESSNASYRTAPNVDRFSDFGSDFGGELRRMRSMEKFTKRGTVYGRGDSAGSSNVGMNGSRAECYGSADGGMPGCGKGEANPGSNGNDRTGQGGGSANGGPVGNGTTSDTGAPQANTQHSFSNGPTPAQSFKQRQGTKQEGLKPGEVRETRRHSVHEHHESETNEVVYG